MALTPEQALEFRLLTLPQQHVAARIEAEIDDRIRKGWQGVLITHPISETPEPVVLFEVARRFKAAGWNVEVQFAQSTVGLKGEIAPGVTFKMLPVWKRV